MREKQLKSDWATWTVVYLSSAVGDGLSAESGSLHDVDVTDPSSALSSSLKSEPTPDSTSSMSSCETASPSAKMLLSVSLLRATRCKSSSQAFDIFFLNADDDDGVDNSSGGGGGTGGTGGAGFSTSTILASVSAIHIDIILSTPTTLSVQTIAVVVVINQRYFRAWCDDFFWSSWHVYLSHGAAVRLTATSTSFNADVRYSARRRLCTIGLRCSTCATRCDE